MIYLSEHKIIPYEILYETLSNSNDLIFSAIPDQEMHVLKSFVQNIKDTMERNINHSLEGLPIVGHHFSFPMELFIGCFDIVPICFEGVSYLLSALLTLGSEPYYDIAENFGHPYHTCTSQKGVIGMTLNKLFEFDAIITPTAPCDNTMASYPFFKWWNDTPLIIGDMPTPHDLRSTRYFKEEMEQMVNELGNVIGQEPDYERLRKTIAHHNQALEYQAEINELKKAKPCPFESVLCPAIAGSVPLLHGKELAQFFKEVVDIGRKRYESGIRPWGEEKIRSVWPYMSVLFDIAMCEWMDRELGMTVLFDMFSYSFFDPINIESDLDTLLMGLSNQALNYPMTRQSATFADPFIDDSVFLAKEYDANCAIFTSHLGCKQSVSLIQIIRESLREQCGIPMLTIDLDVGDKRFTSAQTIRKEIKNFVLTLNL